MPKAAKQPDPEPDPTTVPGEYNPEDPYEGASEPAEGHPDHVEGYEPHFDPEGTTRRVLGFISDDLHLGRPRNTLAVLAEDLADDPNSVVEHNEDEAIQTHLDKLVDAGLVEESDGIYSVTQAGRVELAN
jgi:hypothetical protein